MFHLKLTHYIVGLFVVKSRFLLYSEPNSLHLSIQKKLQTTMCKAYTDIQQALSMHLIEKLRP